MFTSDLFSNPIARYHLSSDDESKTAKNIIYDFYKSINFKNFETLKLKGIEINSKNFYLKGKNKSFILKKINKNEDLNILNKQLLLTNWLSTQKIPIPKVISPDNSSNPLVNFNYNKYYLMEFIDGSYFEGFDNSLLNSVDTILDLFSALEIAPQIYRFKKKQITYCFSSFRKIVEEADRVRSKWKKIFGSNHELLNSSWEKIITTTDILSKRETDFNLMASSLCHIDLHPHNIVMNKDKILGILDLSSIVNSSINTSISFGFFKLARQAAVFEKNNKNIEAIFPKLTKSYESFKKRGYLYDPKDFLFYSQVEIIRRLLLIIELNINHNDMRWNKVLSVQISALYESEFLFNY